jgi:16S rRNA (cytosine967-C5)-methyltransferase
MEDERNIVLNILLDGEKKDNSGKISVSAALDRYADLTDAQRSFIKRLAEGCTEDRIRLDAVISMYSDKGASKQRPAVRNILRMGIWQILWMDAVPDSAACNEAVKLAKRRGFTAMSGFINGLLRNVARNREDVLAKLQNSASAEVRYSIPQWILTLWTEQYGKEKAEKTAAAMNTVRPVTIRLSECLKPAEKEKLLKDLSAADVRVTAGRWLPYAFAIGNTSDIRLLPGFREGLWTVQDESSQLAAEAAGIRGGEIIADVCAAPGGKSLHCADRLRRIGKGGHVSAYDLYPKKIRRIEENAERLGLSEWITAGVRDASLTDGTALSKEAGSSDILLCDLPCSGLGVIGRKNDIRYRVRKEDLASLAALQKKILSNALFYLKEGGTLLYSTCTIDRTENEDMADYIEKELGLVPDALAPYLPAGLPGIDGNRLQLTPDVHGTDGFFIARFRKEAARS